MLAPPFLTIACMKRNPESFASIWRCFATLLVAAAMAVPAIGTASPTAAQEAFGLGPAPLVSDSTVFLSAADLVIGATDAAVDPSSRAASQGFFYSNYDLAEPAINWTGSQASCQPGTTSSAFKSAVLQRIVYFRAMAGVPTGVGLSDSANTADQAAAVMFSRNNAISHYPPSSWTCYSANAASAASSSNIAIGWYGTGAVDAYMLDPGGSNAPAGHRRWLLYPQTQVFGTGDVPRSSSYNASNAIWVFDSNYGGPRPSTRDPFVAWPPQGYVPYQVVYPRWSFSLGNASFAGATVEMRQDGLAIPVTIESRADNGYGENTIVWRPTGMADNSSWARPSADTVYDITIRGIVGGSSSTVSYQVIVFDPASSGSGATATASATPSATATTGFAAGDRVATTVNLRLRSGPGTSFSTLGVLPTGTQGTVTGTSQTSGSYTWVPVSMPGFPDGWVASNYLERLSAGATPTPSLTVSPFLTSTPTSSPTATVVQSTATSIATSTRTATASPSPLPGQFPVGASIQTRSTLRLRSGPSTGSSTFAIMTRGTIGTITGNPVLANGYTFYPVVMNGYGSGWTAGEYLELIQGAQSTVTAVASSTPTPRPPTAIATRTPVPPTATSIPGGSLVGKTVETTTRVNFRAGPGTGNAIVAVLDAGTRGTVLAGPVISGSYTWYQLSIDGTGTGWLADSYIRQVNGGAPTMVPTSTPTNPAGGFPVDSAVWVNTTTLNFRSGPSTQSTVIARMPFGSRGVVTGPPVSAGGVSLVSAADGRLWLWLGRERLPD